MNNNFYDELNEEIQNEENPLIEKLKQDIEQRLKIRKSNIVFPDAIKNLILTGKIDKYHSGYIFINGVEYFLEFYKTVNNVKVELIFKKENNV